MSGYAVVAYVVYGLAQTVSWLKDVRPLALWRWYLLNDPLQSGFGGREICVLLATCVMVTAGGALGFARRDLHS